MYKKGEYDLAGFSVGAVKRSEILPKGIIAGDMLIGTYNIQGSDVQFFISTLLNIILFIVYFVVYNFIFLPSFHTSHPTIHTPGLRSSGVHSNGYSLVRKCVEKSGTEILNSFIRSMTEILHVLFEICSIKIFNSRCFHACMGSSSSTIKFFLITDKSL